MHINLLTNIIVDASVTVITNTNILLCIYKKMLLSSIVDECVTIPLLMVISFLFVGHYHHDETTLDFTISPRFFFLNNH